MEVRELDPYIRIRAALRCDGVGSLDCAEDTRSGMRVAVRWLPLEANGEAAVKAVETIPSHPVLPRIRSTGRVGAAAWVAMDFPEGRLLSTSLDVPMAPETVARVGAEVADALAALHEQGVIHGELSADSILMLPDGRAILWDVPLLMANRLTDRRGEERMLAQLLRMAPFVSPERARGMSLTPASDVYALGALMCIAGGGALPTATSTLAVVHQIASGQRRPEVPGTFAPAVRETVSRMISPDPLSRPDARSVAGALMQVVSQTRTLQNVPVVPVPAVTSEPAAARKRVLIPIGALAALAAVVAVPVALSRRAPVEAPVPPPQERAPDENVSELVMPLVHDDAPAAAAPTPPAPPAGKKKPPFR